MKVNFLMIISIVYLFLIDVTEANLHEWSIVMVMTIHRPKECPWAAAFQLLCEQGTLLLETFDSGRNLGHATLQKGIVKALQKRGHTVPKGADKLIEAQLNGCIAAPKAFSCGLISIARFVHALSLSWLPYFETKSPLRLHLERHNTAFIAESFARAEFYGKDARSGLPLWMLHYVAILIRSSASLKRDL